LPLTPHSTIIPPMDTETVERLLALNREFYAAFARPFAASRPVSDPALVCILPYIPQRASVLDVGCGNGRLALLLNRERPGAAYLGLDATPELVELARAQAGELSTIVRVLCEIASLLKPNGCLILSTWQFLNSARMRRKIVDWSEVDMAGESLEPGDYLLDWKREGRGLRYCHLVDAAEIERLATESGFRVRETFCAGGREGNLSLFAILDKFYSPASNFKA